MSRVYVLRPMFNFIPFYSKMQYIIWGGLTPQETIEGVIEGQNPRYAWVLALGELWGSDPQS